MDKKSCKTCGNPISEDCPPNPKGICPEWQRDAHMWLSIPPEESGWYWHRKDKCQMALKVVYKIGRGLILEEGFDWMPIEEIGGEFQGPIRPEG